MTIVWTTNISKFLMIQAKRWKHMQCYFYHVWFCDISWGIGGKIEVAHIFPFFPSLCLLLTSLWFCDSCWLSVSSSLSSLALLFLPWAERSMCSLGEVWGNCKGSIVQPGYISILSTTQLVLLSYPLQTGCVGRWGARWNPWNLVWLPSTSS